MAKFESYKLTNEDKEIIERMKNNNDNWIQFNKYQAWIKCSYIDGRWYSIIKSYNTIVGFVKDNMYIEIGKYSVTTSKQVTIIHNEKFTNCIRYFADEVL